MQAANTRSSETFRRETDMLSELQITLGRSIQRVALMVGAASLAVVLTAPAATAGPHLAARAIGSAVSVSFDLRDFACGHVGLVGEYEPWKLKQVLASGLPPGVVPPDPSCPERPGPMGPRLRGGGGGGGGGGPSDDMRPC